MLLVQLDRARGVAAEAIVACQPPVEWKFEWPLEHPTDRREMIEFALDEALAAHARHWRRGAGHVTAGLSLRAREPSGDEFDDRFVSPSACQRHVAEFARLKLERLRFREPVSAVSATVLARQARAASAGIVLRAGSAIGGSRSAAAGFAGRSAEQSFGPGGGGRPWLLAEAAARICLPVSTAM